MLSSVHKIVMYRVKRKFSDPEVCKFYIQGFCFMEEFQRTKHNYGDCDKEHDAECKQVSSCQAASHV